MIKLRQATEADWARLYAWRNDADARAASRETGALDLAEHMKWLRRTLGDKQVRLFVAYDDHSGRLVGTGRLNEEKDHIELSVTVDPRARGAGAAVAIVAALVTNAVDMHANRTRIRRLVAEVRLENVPSLRAFAANGFLPALKEAKALGEGWVRLERAL